jgi:hypothetical protein
MPVPLKLTLTFGSSGSLLLIVIVPDLAPAAVGLNATMKVKLPPAARVIGNDGTPLSTNSVGFELVMLVTVTKFGETGGAVLLTVTLCGALCVPTHRRAKLIVVGVT